jgi:hypothetical protein
MHAEWGRCTVQNPCNVPLERACMINGAATRGTGSTPSTPLSAIVLRDFDELAAR